MESIQHQDMQDATNGNYFFEVTMGSPNNYDYGMSHIISEFNNRRAIIKKNIFLKMPPGHGM